MSVDIRVLPTSNYDATTQIVTFAFDLSGTSGTSETSETTGYNNKDWHPVFEVTTDSTKARNVDNLLSTTPLYYNDPITTIQTTYYPLGYKNYNIELISKKYGGVNREIYNLEVEPVKANSIYITNTPKLKTNDSIEIQFKGTFEIGHTYLVAVDDILANINTNNNGDTNEVGNYDDSDVSNNNFFVFTVTSSETTTKDIQPFIYELTPNDDIIYNNISFADNITSVYKLNIDTSYNSVASHTLYSLDNSSSWTKLYDSTLNSTSDLSFQAFNPYIVYMSNELTVTSSQNRLLRAIYQFTGIDIVNISLNDEDKFSTSIKSLYNSRYNIEEDLIHIIVAADNNSILVNVIIDSNTSNTNSKATMISNIQSNFNTQGSSIGNIIGTQTNSVLTHNTNVSTLLENVTSNASDTTGTNYKL